MSMFSGTDQDKNTPARPTAGKPKEPGLSIVSVGMEITGRLDTNGVVKVEGTVRGSIRAERQVLIARGGLVEGDVYTREAIIGGAVSGAIYADERVEVQAESKIDGDITTQKLMVQEGGDVNGNVRMANPDALSRAPKEAPKPKKEARQPQAV